LYAAGSSIGEATSADGVTFTRVDGDPTTPALDPILSPRRGGPAGDAPAFDSGQVADPCIAPRYTPAGRLQIRVLYTGYDGPPGAEGRSSAIGLAARYGLAGPLERAASEVYAVGKHEAAPGFFEWSTGAMLYVQEDSTAKPLYAAIAAAVSPADGLLPKPTGAASSP
jgi:hypothetical protein